MTFPTEDRTLIGISQSSSGSKHVALEYKYEVPHMNREIEHKYSLLLKNIVDKFHQDIRALGEEALKEVRDLD